MSAVDVWSVAGVLNKVKVVLVGDNLALVVSVRISGRVTADILLAMDRITSTYSGMIL